MICFISGLWEHNRTHGSTNHLYKCTTCSKKFSSRQGFLIHQRKHNNERPYGCRYCWKAFRDGGTLRKHERIHTGERPHVCPICKKAFNQKVVLREHVRSRYTENMTPNAHQRFECELCLESFADKDELCAHIVRHSDEIAQRQKSANAAEKKANISDQNASAVENEDKKIDCGNLNGVEGDVHGDVDYHVKRVKTEQMPTLTDFVLEG